MQVVGELAAVREPAQVRVLALDLRGVAPAQSDELRGLEAEAFAGLPCLLYSAAARQLARWPRSSLTCVSASQESAFSAAKVPKAMA